MIADGAGEQDFIAGSHSAGIDVDAGDGGADSGGSDVHAIGLATLDDLRIAADHGDSGALEGIRHGANFGFEERTCEAFFKDKRDDHRVRFGSGDSEVIHGPIDGEFADGAAGKAQGMNDEAVGGEGDGGSADFDVSGVG